MRNDGTDYLKQKELAFLRAPEFKFLDFRTLSNGNPPLLLLLLWPCKPAHSRVIVGFFEYSVLDLNNQLQVQVAQVMLSQ